MAVIGGKQERTFFDDLYFRFNAPKLENKVVFFRLLAVTQKAGLGIRESLQSIEKAETHPGLKKILQDTIAQINEGMGLSNALSKYDNFFQSSEIELIRSAEQMGTLPDTLDSMARELEKFEFIKKKMKSAMMYPAVIIVVAIIAILILLIKVIPSILTIFPPDLELPAVTRYVMATSNFLQSYWLPVITVLVGTPIVYGIVYRSILPFKIFIDRIMLNAPVAGPLIKTFYRYRFSKLLGDFYNAGLSPLVSLDQIANIFQNYHYKKKVLDVKKDLEIGLEMTESFEGSYLFNPILIQIIGIGEKAGNIGEVLDKMSVFYRDELDTKVEGLTKMVEPLLMVFVAGIIGVIVSSIFLPMADLIGAMSSG